MSRAPTRPAHLDREPTVKRTADTHPFCPGVPPRPEVD
jgi:hypothetical protein